MPRTLLPTIALLPAMLILAACASPTPTPFVDLHPELGKPFEMGIGQSAFIDAEGFRIDLKAVLSDNRCPPTGECLQPDVVIIQADIRETAEAEPRTEELFFDAGASTEAFGRYDIQVLGVAPDVDEVESPSDYVITLRITESNADLTLNPAMAYSRASARVGDEVTFTASADGSGLAQYTLTANNTVVGIIRYDGSLVRGSQSPAVELAAWSADANQASWTVRMLNAGRFTMTASVSGEVPIANGAFAYAYGTASAQLTIE